MPRTISVIAKEWLTRGRWYYGFTCAACRKPVAVFEDTSQGQEPFSNTDDVVLSTHCPYCQTKSKCASGDIKAFLAA